MSEHELEKLLGGFAADTLTEDEKQRLYAAALHDQQLFNTLADEQALKELLADPTVRRRLLQALNQASTSGAGGSLAWLDWFRKPASLAFAGGLVAAVFAVVLGTKVYQDSLRQAAQSVATEEATSTPVPPPTPPASEPALPNVAQPELKAKTNADTTIAPAKKEEFTDKLKKRERAARPQPQEPQAAESTHAGAMQQRELDEVRKQAEAPLAALGTSEEEVIPSAHEQQAASSAPPARAPASLQAPVGAPAADAIAPTISARALFYGGEPARLDGRIMAEGKERATKSLDEPGPQANRPQRKLDQFALTGKSAGTTIQAKLLGLRYSFVARGTDGQDREVDAATAAKSMQPISLTVETNQDAYLQVWKTVGASTPKLLLPQKETGQTSLKIAAGQRQIVSLPTNSGAVTLTARLSRVPFGPITRQEAAMFDRLLPNQLRESVTEGGRAGSQEEATYVVSQDPAQTAQLVIAILLRR